MSLRSLDLRLLTFPKTSARSALQKSRSTLLGFRQSVRHRLVNQRFHLPRGFSKNFSLPTSQLALKFSQLALLLSEGSLLLAQLPLFLTGHGLNVAQLALQLANLALNAANILLSAACPQRLQFAFEFMQVCGQIRNLNVNFLLLFAQRLLLLTKRFLLLAELLLLLVKFLNLSEKIPRTLDGGRVANHV